MPYPFRNKEISWLSFNARVLQEASDRSVPVIDRMRFLGIFSSNQDEFYRVRIATLHRLARLGRKGKKLLGHDPKAVLREIKEIILKQQAVFQGAYAQILEELAKQGIHLVDETQLTPEQGIFVRSYFRSEVRPKLTPLMVRAKVRFPELRDKSIYLATRLRTKGGKNDRFALIEVPTDALPRFLTLPHVGRDQYVILLEDVIRYNLKEIFSLFEFESIESHIAKLTRDAELDIDDDVTESYVRKVVKGIKLREEGNPVRLVCDREISEEFRKLLVRKLGLKTEDSFVPGGRTHNHKDFIDFPRVGRQALLYPAMEPVPFPPIESKGSILAAMKQQEFLLHFPYQPFDYVIDLLREAAIDPKVTAIKVTLYRVARHSGVANALLNAARNGKQVTAIIELQARFDEEANVALANQLQKEGGKVIFGVPGLKVHAKIGLIVRKEKGKLQRYAFLGTGNLNEDTAKVYSDHCLFTTDRRLTKEVESVFAFLQDNYRVGDFRHLMVSPFGFREGLTKLVRNEIRNKKKGKEAYIDLKLNNIADPEMLGLLYHAADAGVSVRLNVRGMYSVLPSAVEHPENIEAIGIVDRFLEHSRILVFANGGNEKVFLSSADWMTRNLDRRVEVTFPIYDPKLQKDLKEFLELQWTDNVKARILDEPLSNQYRPRKGEAVRSQSAFYELVQKRTLGEELKEPKPQATA
jgi:polyphosphate kinase